MEHGGNVKSIKAKRSTLNPPTRNSCQFLGLETCLRLSFHFKNQGTAIVAVSTYISNWEQPAIEWARLCNIGTAASRAGLLSSSSFLET